VRYLSAMVKLDANIDAVILRQSAQLQTKVLTSPGPEVGNDNCTAPQKQVAVASSSVDQPSPARPATGKTDLEVSNFDIFKFFKNEVLKREKIR